MYAFILTALVNHDPNQIHMNSSHVNIQSATQIQLAVDIWVLVIKCKIYTFNKINLDTRHQEIVFGIALT